LFVCLFIETQRKFTICPFTNFPLLKGYISVKIELLTAMYLSYCYMSCDMLSCVVFGTDHMSKVDYNLGVSYFLKKAIKGLACMGVCAGEYEKKKYQKDNRFYHKNEMLELSNPFQAFI